MLANLVHETATPVGALSVTVAAGTDDGDLRISDRFPVGSIFYYMMKSSTASNDDFEEGIGTVTATATFERTVPQVTYDGTTLDSTSPAKLVFDTDVDVWATPSSDALMQTLTNVASTGNKFLYSDHVGVGSTSITKSTLADRVWAIPYLPRYAGLVDALRDETTSAAGSIYRWSIRATDPATGLPGEELWQSGDITSVVAVTEHSVSPNVKITGEPLWILVLSDTAMLMRGINREEIHSSQIGANATQMRNNTALFDDIAGTWTDIPASSSLTWGVDQGSPIICQLGFV